MLAIISVILPAAIIVIAGYVAGKRVLDAAGVKALSDLVYFLFLPCLLCRSMATASFGGSDAKLLATYYGASLLWFFAVALFLKLRKSAATPAAIVFALGAVFSNTVQLGIPIIKLAFGDDGLKMHLSIIAMHTLVLLTVGTIWLELSQAHAGDDAPPLSQTIGPVIKSAVLHPVILPIVAGLLWSDRGDAQARDAGYPGERLQPLARRLRIVEDECGFDAIGRDLRRQFHIAVRIAAQRRDPGEQDRDPRQRDRE